MINPITSNNSVVKPETVRETAAQSTAKTTAQTTANEAEAAVYEKTEQKAEEKPVRTQPADPDLIERLKAEAEERNAQLRSLVEKMLLKQSGTVFNGEGLASVFRKLEVDDETRAQAQRDIAEDGYWGIEQTSDRIVSFAKGMAGDDPELAKSMYDAVKEGFKQAEKAWGEKLPDISQQTMEATYRKLDEWLASLNVAP